MCQKIWIGYSSDIFLLNRVLKGRNGISAFPMLSLLHVVSKRALPLPRNEDLGVCWHR